MTKDEKTETTTDDLTPRGIRLGVLCQATIVDLVKLLAEHPAPDAGKIGCAVMMWDHMGNFTVASNGKTTRELITALRKVKRREGQRLVDVTRERAPAPAELWERAAHDQERYAALLETYGYARGQCPTCLAPTDTAPVGADDVPLICPDPWHQREGSEG